MSTNLLEILEKRHRGAKAVAQGADIVLFNIENGYEAFGDSATRVRGAGLPKHFFGFGSDFEDPRDEFAPPIPLCFIQPAHCAAAFNLLAEKYSVALVEWAGGRTPYRLLVNSRRQGQKPASMEDTFFDDL